MSDKTGWVEASAVRARCGWFLGFAVTLACCWPGLSMAGDLAAELDPILAGDHRDAGSPARDRYRHPEQTLSFFGVEPDQTVVEIWPGGGGWYTELLGPLLRERGLLYCAHWRADSPVGFFRQSRERFDQKLALHPEVYDRVVVTVLEPPAAMEIAPDGRADRVLTFRNVHNWMKVGRADTVFEALYRALKPGGILGVVEHRAKPDTTRPDMIASGYVTESEVKRLAGAAGFEFEAASEINANPLDNADHPHGVWTLPPSLRLGEVDRSKYQAIGESDRMTLKFRKPASDSAAP